MQQVLRYAGIGLLFLSLVIVSGMAANTPTVSVKIAGDGKQTVPERTVATLEAGWNILYWHVSTNMSYSRISEACSKVVVMGLQNGELYTETQHLTAGSSYLVRTEQACQLTSNAPAVQQGLYLQSGWNIAGVSSSLPAASLQKRCGDTVIFKLVDGQLQHATKTLKEHTAYLIRVDQACSMPPGVPTDGGA